MICLGLMRCFLSLFSAPLKKILSALYYGFNDQPGEQRSSAELLILKY